MSFSTSFDSLSNSVFVEIHDDDNDDEEEDDDDYGNSTTKSPSTTSPVTHLIESGVVHGNGKKQLVFLAGPQLSAMTTVQEFFVHHASNYRSHQRAESLLGYSWPYVSLPEEYQNLVPHYRNFDLLVTHSHDDDYDELFRIFINAIQQEWENNSYGIILGTEYFDSNTFGNNADSLDVMKKIVRHLRITDPNQVQVVLSYESPRANIWNRFYQQQHLQKQQQPILGNSTTTLEGSTYENWICNNSDTNLHLLYTTLDTSMNPLQLAVSFRQEDWLVDILDVTGIQKAERDLAHVIGCLILNNSTCHLGWLKDLQSKFSTANTNALEEWGEKLPLPNAGGLEESEWNELENLFASRDCYYKDLLMRDENVRVLYKSAVWSQCESNSSNHSESTTYYKYFSDTSNMLWEIQQQKNCSTGLYIPVQHEFNDMTFQQFVSTIAAAVVALGFMTTLLRILCMRRRRRYSEKLSQQLKEAELSDLESSMKPTLIHTSTVYSVMPLSRERLVGVEFCSTNKYPQGDPWSREIYDIPVSTSGVESESIASRYIPQNHVTPYRYDSAHLAHELYHHEKSFSRFEYDNNTSLVQDFEQIDLSDLKY